MMPTMNKETEMTKPPKTILRRIIAEIRTLSRIYPEVRYDRSHGDSVDRGPCRYTPTEGNPHGCIVGAALSRIGLLDMERSDLKLIYICGVGFGSGLRANALLVKSLGVESSDKDSLAMVEWVKAVQLNQDSGTAWSEAVNLADHATPETELSIQTPDYDLDALINEVRKIVAENPGLCYAADDPVYVGCNYYPDEGNQLGCIIGAAFSNLGWFYDLGGRGVAYLTLLDGQQIPQGSINDLLREMPPFVEFSNNTQSRQDWLLKVQNLQDKGELWSDAIKEADKQLFDRQTDLTTP